MVVPFPRYIDRPFVRRHARRMLESDSASAERWLAYQLKLQGEVMRRRGIDRACSEEQLRYLEVAIRAAVSQLMAGAA